MAQYEIYIAGPMSGIEDHNKPAFIKGEQDITALMQGEHFNIFNPIINETSLMVQEGKVRDTQEAYRMCMAINCAYLCEHATHIYMLEGWETSPGAKAEHALAVCLGLRILYQI